MNNDDQTLDNSADLDETLDDLADAPSQAPFPAGAHLATVSLFKNDKKAGSYYARFTYKAPLELTDPSVEAPKEGDQATVFYATKKKDGSPNTIGQGQLKIVAKPLGDLLSTTSVAAIIEGSKSGIDVVIVNTVRVDKSGQYEPSMNVTKCEVYTG